MIAAASLCLALNLYHEARGTPIMAQYAVAMVTMNRARNDQRKVCDTVLKPYQFSWANGGAIQQKGGVLHLSDHLRPKEPDAWDTALRISNAVLAGRMPDFTNGSTHYHHRRIKPVWAEKMTQTKSFGPHHFYRDNKSSVTII